MMKQEFDEISRSLGFGECDADMHFKEIEPTYMRWGQDEMITKEEMARMYWGQEKGDNDVWTTLNSAWRKAKLVDEAMEKTGRIFNDCGMKVPANILDGFMSAKAMIWHDVHSTITGWREKRKTA